MADRIDIDALLISALYGELTPAEEARLTAHLESHPADRSALADLTQTRAVFRDSRLLAVQFEPPQSVSALLLQEAARRAPRVAREPSEGWFQRFVRSFLAHPAMAAATMLVLVAGVAGTLFLRSGEHFAATAPPPTAASTPQVAATVRAPAAAQAEPSVGGLADDNTAGAPSAAPATTAAGSGAYRVRLDEAEPETAQSDAVANQVARAEPAGPQGEAKAAKAAKDDAKAVALDGARKGEEVRELTRNAEAPGKFAAPAPKLAKKASGKSAGASAPSGIELRRQELMPKELDEERKLGRPSANDPFASANEHAAAPGGGAAAAPGMVAAQPRPVAPSATPPASAPAPRSDPNSDRPAIANRGALSGGNKGKESSPVTKPAPVTSVAQAQAPSRAAPPPPPAQATADTAAGRKLADKAAPADSKADDKSAEDRALLGWAQKQRDQVIALVRSNNCRQAATAATEIYNRAPDYYAANVATDRSVKPCLAYITSDREREDRSKALDREERSRAASKRANAADAPAAAPAPPATPPPTRK